MRAWLALLFLLPHLAQAGAWPREAGQVYVSISQEVDFDGWTGLFAEYGLPRDLTIGVDIGGHAARGGSALFIGDDGTADATDGRAIVFLRAPLPIGRSHLPNWKFAVEVGLGADWDAAGDTVERARFGLSAGRPLTTPLGSGWLNVDAKVEPGRGAPTRFGFGAVAGLRLTDRQVVELGLFVEEDDGATTAILPTYQLSVPRLGDLRIGATIRLDGQTDLRIGLARTF